MLHARPSLPRPRALQDDGLQDQDLVEKLLGESDRERGHRIRCPKCRWSPTKHDLWRCSCEHLWNTFDTGGVCPACARRWQDTQCPRCHEWSPHREWYERAEDIR
jgi:hypothetical protein